MVSKYFIDKNIKIEDYLSLNHLSKGYINKLISLNAITTDKENVVSGFNLKKGDYVYINFSVLEDNSLIEKSSYCINEKDIIYEDSNIICVDKPKGILVHSDGNTTDTLLNRVVTYLENKYDDSYIRCLHRIDVDTSGVVIFCKNIFSYCYLSYLMENKMIKKEYLAYVKGSLYKEQDINLYIGKDRHNSKKYIGLTNKTPNSFTSYKIIKTFNDKTLVKVFIKTGKPHQIRVSFASIGFPILGDKLYGNDNNKAMYLLSNMISFDLFNKPFVIKTRKKIDEL